MYFLYKKNLVMPYKVFISAVLLFFMNLSWAQVVINEYSASNLRSFPDNYGKYEDWIELYNPVQPKLWISAAGIFLIKNQSQKNGKYRQEH